MALLAVNTGCRDSEVCGLRWDWEVRVPELDTTVFMIPGSRVKNGDERLVVLNRVASSVVDSRRGRHPTHVFVHSGRPVGRMLNGAWLRGSSAQVECELKGPAKVPHGDLQLVAHDRKHLIGMVARGAPIPA